MTAERFTLDTNVLYYSVDRDAGQRHLIAREVMGLAIGLDCFLTLQSASEFYAASTRKGLITTAEAAAQVSDWLDAFPCLRHSVASVRQALALAAERRASYWDALLVATAAEGGCTAILSEDMHDGLELAGVRVIDPFGAGGLSAAACAFLGR